MSRSLTHTHFGTWIEKCEKQKFGIWADGTGVVVGVFNTQH